ncbi:MAG: diaminopimelate decarboxylase family protein [Bacteroidia bacterium]
MDKAQLVDWGKNLDIESLIQSYGSPAWIVSEAQLKENVAHIESFTGARQRIFYPVKTNPSLSVLQLLSSMQVGADCASRAEIDLACLAGMQYSSISYNSPVQDVELCKMLLQNGARVVMDDPDAILALDGIIQPSEMQGRLILRLNLADYGAYTEKNANQELMAHGHTSSKFGIPVEELEALVVKLQLPVSGVHVHVGTQMDNLHSFEDALHQMHDWASRLLQLGQPIQEINIGGGLGIPFSEKDHFPSLKGWADALIKIKKSNFTYFVEPGHALVGNAVALLMQVQTIKKSRGKKWAITDVGTDQLTKITLLHWPHRILSASGAELPAGNDAVAGPLCFTGDTLLENVSVAGLEKGSPLLLTEAGAYTYSLANRFNGRLAPQWLVLHSNGSIVQTLRKEDRFENLQLANHTWQVVNTEPQEHAVSVQSIHQLSSGYLRESSAEDSFSYVSMVKTAYCTYVFEVLTASAVDFISMPFAIRILGDATIVAVLHHDGFETKQQSVWGRRLVMDCFKQVPANAKFQFTLSLSDTIQAADNSTRMVRFRSACGNCVGSFVVVY